MEILQRLCTYFLKHPNGPTINSSYIQHVAERRHGPPPWLHPNSLGLRELIAAVCPTHRVVVPLEQSRFLLVVIPCLPDNGDCRRQRHDIFGTWLGIGNPRVKRFLSAHFKQHHVVSSLPALETLEVCWQPLSASLESPQQRHLELGFQSLRKVNRGVKPRKESTGSCLFLIKNWSRGTVIIGRYSYSTTLQSCGEPDRSKFFGICRFRAKYFTRSGFGFSSGL